MSELFGSIRLKDKFTILVPMVALAIVLATLIGVLTFCTADTHTHIYDYKLELVDGQFNLSGICTVDNCEDPFLQMNNLSDVKVLSSIRPTCSSAGERVYAYTHGNTTITFKEVVNALPHTYMYELVPAAGKYMLIGSCMVEGCTDPHLNIDGVTDFELQSTVKGDCFVPDQLTYSYVVNGESKTFTTMSLTTAPHTVAGLTADKVVNADGSFNFGTSGVIVNAGQPYACGTKVDGYYVCEYCKQVVSAEILYPNHAFAYSEDGLILPTLEDDGCAVLDCQNKGCHESLEIKIPMIVVEGNTQTVSAATELHREVVKYEYVSVEYGFNVYLEFEVGELLSHKYEYRLQIDPSNNRKINLVGVCHQPDCQTPDYFEADVDADCVDTSTCQKEGIVTWSYVKDGELITFSAVSTILGHHDYIYDGNRAMPPTIYNNGFVEIHCNTEGCEEVVLLTLPKVVVGENTEIVGEMDDKLIGEYTYFSEEHLCVIKLTVTIYAESVNEQ